MPVYVFVCPRGHEHEAYFPYKDRPTSIGCATRRCRETARFSIAATHRSVQLIPDIPEHENMSLGMTIRSRRHLRDVQKQKNCQDWEGGVPDPPSDWR